jgi:hypothetical protein
VFTHHLSLEEEDELLATAEEVVKVKETLRGVLGSQLRGGVWHGAESVCGMTACERIDYSKQTGGYH